MNNVVSSKIKLLSPSVIINIFFTKLVLFQSVEGEHHEKAVELLKQAHGMSCYDCYGNISFNLCLITQHLSESIKNTIVATNPEKCNTHTRKYIWVCFSGLFTHFYLPQCPISRIDGVLLCTCGLHKQTLLMY